MACNSRLDEDLIVTDCCCFVTRVIRVFDKLGQGWIMSTDLRDVMKHLGERLSDPEVDDMLKEADREGKGRVFYQGMSTRTLVNFKVAHSNLRNQLTEGESNSKLQTCCRRAVIRAADHTNQQAQFLFHSVSACKSKIDVQLLFKTTADSLIRTLQLDGNRRHRMSLISAELFSSLVHCSPLRLAKRSSFPLLMIITT
jgi:hypothetical protein